MLIRMLTVIGTLLTLCAVPPCAEGQITRQADRLYLGVAERLFGYDPLFGGREVLVTFGVLGTEPELQIQFPMDFSDSCNFSIRYLPRDGDSAYQQLFALLAAEPAIGPDEAAARIVGVERITGTGECASRLGRVIGEFSRLSLQFSDDGSSDVLYIGGLTYRLDVYGIDLKVRVEVPSALDVPLVHWLNDLRQEVLAVVESRR